MNFRFKIALVSLIAIVAPLGAQGTDTTDVVDVYATGKFSAATNHQETATQTQDSGMSTGAVGGGIDYQERGGQNGFHVGLEASYLQQLPTAIPGKKGAEGELVVEEFLPFLDRPAGETNGGLVVGGKFVDSNAAGTRMAVIPAGISMPLPLALGGFAKVKLGEGKTVAGALSWTPLQVWESRIDPLTARADFGNAHALAALDLQNPGAKVVSRQRLNVDVDYLYLNSVDDTTTGETGTGHLVSVQGVYDVELGHGKTARPLVGVFGDYTFDTERFDDGSTMTHGTGQVGARAGVSF